METMFDTYIEEREREREREREGERERKYKIILIRDDNRDTCRKKCKYIYPSLIKIKIIRLVNLHFSLKLYFFKNYRKCTFSACNFYTIILNLLKKIYIYKRVKSSKSIRILSK